MDLTCTARRATAALAACIAIAAIPACTSERPSDATAGSGTVYAIGLTVAAPTALPACTSSLADAVAYVVAPAGLWKCVADRWVALPCNGFDVGAVAYAASTNTLVACVDRRWTPIALPPGPEGPPGPAAAQPFIRLTPIPPGSRCPAGGTEIAIGLSDVVTETTTICNGVSGSGGADGGDDGAADGASTGDASDASPACGPIGVACCAGGTACIPPVPGATVECLQGVCASCGGSNEPCCSASSPACRGDINVCFQGTCQTCGLPGGPCCNLGLCPPGAVGIGSGCGVTGYVCSAASGGTCIACGGHGQVCCTDRFDPAHNGLGVCGGPPCLDGSSCGPDGVPGCR